jgi:hypothetical protein
MALADDVRRRLKGDEKALDNPPPRSEKKKPAVTKKSLRRLIENLTEEQRGWLRDALLDFDYGLDDNEDEDEGEDDE